MTLPAAVRADVEYALETATGSGGAILSARPLTGGCVSPVARVTTAGGDAFFLKWAGAGHPPGLLDAEARGLRLLASTATVRVPELVATPPTGDGWLLLEWIEPGPPGPASWTRLGEDLAALHRHRADRFGADLPNFIGPLPQDNARSPAWADFWRTRRLEPQLRRAVDGGAFGREDRARFQRLLATLEERIGIGEAEGASTLHGDLWSGNVHMAAAGAPAVIDPSAYHGHREVDLAMAELFGGFEPPFRQAYEAAWPLEHGYAPTRRAVYQLYYLLVHINLFGSAYVAGARRALQDAGL
ncbi:MAG TPA: fructosamine kinase family protein [Longimicrobiales bacterium]|nr:fructosamine kinase family protein [Longimicrobiales bacterium]